MLYFKDCKNSDQAKKTYYKLALQMHPDVGGNEQDFKELLNQFENFRPETEKFDGEIDNWENLSGIYANIIAQLITLEGLEIEIVGSYIWVGGDTKKHKEAIKAIDCVDEMKALWARKKKKWYFKPANYRPRVRREYVMEEIRDIYGSQKVKGNGRLALA